MENPYCSCKLTASSADQGLLGVPGGAGRDHHHPDCPVTAPAPRAPAPWPACVLAGAAALVAPASLMPVLSRPVARHSDDEDPLEAITLAEPAAITAADRHPARTGTITATIELVAWLSAYSTSTAAAQVSNPRSDPPGPCAACLSLDVGTCHH